MDPQIAQWRADTPGCAHRNHLNNAGAALSSDSRAIAWHAWRLVRRTPGLGYWQIRLLGRREHRSVLCVARERWWRASPCGTQHRSGGVRSAGVPGRFGGTKNSQHAWPGSNDGSFKKQATIRRRGNRSRWPSVGKSTCERPQTYPCGKTDVAASLDSGRPVRCVSAGWHLPRNRDIAARCLVRRRYRRSGVGNGSRGVRGAIPDSLYVSRCQRAITWELAR